VATRQASAIREVVTTKSTITLAETHVEHARAKHRKALLKAHEQGVTVQLLAEATGSSWSRISKQLKRARLEAGK